MSKAVVELYMYMINSALISNLDLRIGTATPPSNKSECFMQKSASNLVEMRAQLLLQTEIILGISVTVMGIGQM